MKKKNPAAGAPISIRLADDLKRDLDDAALKLKMDTHQVMRLAMEVGLEHFTRIDHKLAACIVERIASEAKKKNPIFNQPRAITDAVQFTEPTIHLMKVIDPGESELLWGDHLLDHQFNKIVQYCLSEGKAPPVAQNLGTFNHYPKGPEIDLDSFNAATLKRTEDIISGMIKLNEAPASPSVTEPRTEVTYSKKKRP